MTDIDSMVFELIEAGEGMSELRWERAEPCPRIDPSTKQPVWECPLCNGTGVIYAEPETIQGLFRSQARMLSFRREGEFAHGDAELTTMLDVKPGYVDRRVRDRFTVLPATGDEAEERVFYPSAPASPFIVGNVQRAWRVSLQAASEKDRLVT